MASTSYAKYAGIVSSASGTTGDLTDVGTDGITITGGTGAVNGAGTQIAQHVADASHNGYLSLTDWSTFNSKQAALTFSAPLVNTANTISIPVSTSSANGYLSSADWTTFNAKQPAGSYITALTGDATATGPGSVALTLATVNSNVGSFGGATSVSAITVNAKGLVTAAASTSIQIAESQVTNLVSDLAGKQATGNYITALTGDATAAGPGSAALTLATVNSNVGSFGSATQVTALTVNAKGLVTAAASTSIQIAESQVTNLVSDLAGKQATGNYVTALTGDVTATGPGSVAATIAANAVTNAKAAQMATLTLKGNNTGGTANALDLTVAQVNTMLGSVSNPMTTLGDMIYGGTSGAFTRLAGDTSNTRKFFREQSAAGVAAAPAWDTLVAGDIPSLAASIITSGTLATARGGTNLDTSGSTGLAKVASGTWSVATLVDADVSSTAAIAATKLAPFAYRTVTGTATAAATDESILANNSSAYTVTLPTAVGISGKVYCIAAIGTSIVNFISIGTTSSQTIGGRASLNIKLRRTGDFVQVISDGTNWQIIAIFETIQAVFKSTAGNNITNAFADVAFATAVEDTTNSNFSGTVFTADVPGMYQVSYGFRVPTPGAGSIVSSQTLFNASVVSATGYSCQATGEAANLVGTAHNIRLNGTSDTIKVQAKNSGGTVAYDTAAGTMFIDIIRTGD